VPGVKRRAIIRRMRMLIPLGAILLAVAAAAPSG